MDIQARVAGTRCSRPGQAGRSMNKSSIIQLTKSLNPQLQIPNQQNPVHPPHVRHDVSYSQAFVPVWSKSSRTFVLSMSIVLTAKAGFG